MKIEKREIAVLIVTLVIIVTANAWWRVKETGRRAKIALQQEAAMKEAGADAGAASPPETEKEGGAE